jgi:hypothetical protein
MKPIISAMFLPLIVTLCVSGVAAQQSNPRRVPVLTSEDLRAHRDSNPEASPAAKPTARDSARWQRYSPAELALSIELPGKPLSMGLSFPDAAGQEMGPARAYTYQSEQISVLVLRFAGLKPPVSLSSLSAFGKGFLAASARKPGVSDVEHDTIPKDDSTVLLQGIYTEGSVVFETRGFVHTNGREVWLVVTRFAQADESAGDLSLRVINSVKFD